MVSDLLSRERGVQSVFEFVRPGRGTSAAHVNVPIIDAPVVNQMTVSIEDGDLRRNLHVTESDEFVSRIAHHRNLVSELGYGFANLLRTVALVGINQPEGGTIAVLFADALDHGSVAAEDGTVATNKNVPE